MARFGRVLTAMVTPFDSNGALDLDGARTLARYLQDHGNDGIVVAGTTGEASTLTDDERLALIRVTVDECSEAGSVVAGTGSNDTAHSVHLTEAAKDMGVDAVLAVTPYYNRPPAQGIVRHVAAIAEVGVPVVLYNIPGRTGVNMPPDLIVELAGIPGVVALKQAAGETDSASARKGFYVSVPDGMPFETDEAAVAHVMANHLGAFFETAEVEVDPPKGNFQVINKCSLTGELLGPPNYHRYNQIVQQHHAARVGGRMSIEAYRTRIETGHQVVGAAHAVAVRLRR